MLHCEAVNTASSFTFCRKAKCFTSALADASLKPLYFRYLHFNDVITEIALESVLFSTKCSSSAEHFASLRSREYGKQLHILPQGKILHFTFVQEICCSVARGQKDRWRSSVLDLFAYFFCRGLFFSYSSFSFFKSHNSGTVQIRCRQYLFFAFR